MKIQCRHIRSGKVMCEIRISHENFMNNEIPFISCPSCCVFDYLTDDNIKFDWRTGEVSPSEILDIWKNY